MAGRLALVAIALAAAATAQVVPRVTNTRGCTGFGLPCTIRLQEGLDVTASFTLDEPIVCNNNDDFECAVIVNISNSAPHLVAVQPCFVKWERSEWHQTKQVRITAVQNYRQIPGESHQVHLNAQTLSTAAYYHNFSVRGFYIATIDRRTAQCRSTGDPHYSTFDGMYWHYYQASDVTLYRAPDRDFAIQTRTIGYPGRNCAIAGRENRDRVIIDACSASLRVTTSFNSANSDVHPRIQVSGSTYTVYFYSGAWMRTEVNGWGMNVYASSVDFTPSNALAPYSCGLCGNFDGNPNNDVPGYVITNYNALWPCMKVPSIAVKPSTGLSVSFGSIWTWVYNEADFSGVGTVVPLPRVNCPYEFMRIDRPVINTEDQEDITDALNDRANDVQNQNDGGFGFTFGGAGDNATVVADYPLNLSLAACFRSVNTSLTVQLCASFYPAFNASLANYTNDCAVDYSHAGGPTQAGNFFLTSSLRALEADCLQLAVANNDTNLVALQQVLCSNACSGRGNCTAGARCVCQRGYGGSDCSVDLNAPPTILSASDLVYDSSGLDRNNTPREILISGFNILLGANLSCRFNTTITTATWLGPTQVLCAVPALFHRGPTVLRVPLAVTNDGTLWSNSSAHFLYYDGTCQVCTEAGVCGPNPQTCNIDGRCYLPSTQRPASGSTPSNPCQVCSPTRSTTNWTFDYSPSACRPMFTMPIYGFEIVGAATVGTPVLTVNGRFNTLVSADPSYSVRYTYLSNIATTAIRQWFNVDPVTGVVSLSATVNMSDPTFMNMQHAAGNPTNFNGFFQVLATDNQNYTTAVDVIIDLVPASVHGAIFPPLGFSGMVFEGALPGSPVYNLSNTSQPLFIRPLTNDLTVDSYDWFFQPIGMNFALSIHRITGAVTVNQSSLLDFETNPYLNYRVRAVVSLQYITPLYVQVMDSAETPTAVRANGGSVASVNESTRTSNFIANLTTIDGDATPPTWDGGPFTYTIVAGVGSTNFQLLQWVAGQTNTTYLAVMPNVVFDFESGNNVFSVSIRSTDPTSRSVTSAITVSVVDVNEAPTSISITPMPVPSAGVSVTSTTSTCSIRMPENTTVGALIATLSATDPDTGAAQPPCFVIDPLNYLDQNGLYMEVQTRLDFESVSSFNVTITCTDAINFGLELSRTCGVTVIDSPEPPQLVSYNYTGGSINETIVRTTPLIVGVITAVDFDRNSTGNITFIVPAGYTTTTPVCTIIAMGAVQCVTNLILLPTTPVSFVNSTFGIITVPVVISQGGMNATVYVNVTVTDEPELPTGITVTPLGTLFEAPEVNFTIALITLNDPDTTPQTYLCALSSNPNGAFALRDVPGDISSRFLVVANPSAFVFAETMQRSRRQAAGGANSVAFTITVSEPSNPRLGSLSYTSSVDVADRPLEATANATVISPFVGEDTVQLSVRYQDIPSLSQYLRWSLVSTTLITQMGAVSVSPMGAITVTSPGGLCPFGGADRFLINVRYSFASYTGTLPPGYSPVSSQFELMIGSASAAYPYFNTMTTSIVVRPSGTLLVQASTPVVVNAPCGSTVDYALTVASIPTRVTNLNSLNQNDLVLVRDGSRGFIRPQAGELTAKIQSGEWIISNVFSTSVAPTNGRFRFSTGVENGGVNTGSQAVVTAGYLAAGSPSLPFRDTTRVLIAEITGTGRVSISNLTVNYLDACGLDVNSVQVQPNSCSQGQTCVSSFGQGGWSAICITPIIDIGVDASTSSASASKSVGLWVGIIILVILAVLVVLFLYFRHQKNSHIEFDSDVNKGMSRAATYNNPTYDSVQGGTPGDTTFKAGVKSAVYDWYKPKMSRRECTEYLLAQGEGAFVVRDSDSNMGWHMLGVKTANRVVHDKIRLNEQGMFELLPSVGDAADTKQPAFKSLPDLVDHYLLNGDVAGLGYTLVDSNPIYDNHQLVQERTGEAVKAQYDDIPAVPIKGRTYDEVPSAFGGGMSGVSNPTYGKDGSGPDGYLEVTESAPCITAGMAYEAI